ncbi:hypothetical protein [Pluralibacter gergoviae]|uniref:hypothetical protein n=1 Tax=Pluralibacter gergoviae TaxID=61647 RepID=UPI001FF662FC|nr:hypothetical protein [Pluralibacter gergoviae]MCK1065087.1 hypothetical protein [Pluralibacter gergoviae]HDS1113604.1 hypothetical protein [Pluralibacter gergoviae]
MILERGQEMSDGRVIFWMDDIAISCVESHDKKWRVGHYDREEFDSLRENTVALINSLSIEFLIKVGQGYSVKALCVACNGTLVFSVHRDPNADMVGIVVVDRNQRECFRIDTSTHLISCSISELGRYLALSFSGSRNKSDPYGNRLEVYDLTTGEVLASFDKGNDLRYAEIVVTEPEGNVVAFYKGKSFKVC